jgi:hypothetical protein
MGARTARVCARPCRPWRRDQAVGELERVLEVAEAVAAALDVEDVGAMEQAVEDGAIASSWWAEEDELGQLGAHGRPHEHRSRGSVASRNCKWRR